MSQDIVAEYLARMRDAVEEEMPRSINCPACERDVEPGELHEAQERLQRVVADLLLQMVDELQDRLVERAETAMHETIERVLSPERRKV